MQRARMFLLVLIIIMLSMLTAGCWNYREIDKLSIVAGIAIDKGTNEKYEITVEIIRISAGKDNKMTSETLSVEGKTLFDTVRKIISISGKRLYWSHNKVVILSKAIASEGVSEALELYNRDAETRQDVHIFISKEDTAKEIFSGQQTTENILSFALDEILDNDVSLSKAPVIDLLTYDIQSQSKGMSPTIPVIGLVNADDKRVPQIMGAAIIKENKFAGFLDGDETKDLLFIRNEIKGGVLTEEMQTDGQPTLISLEIFNNRTDVNPSVQDNDIAMNVNIDTTVAVDEINGPSGFINEDGLNRLKQQTESTLKERVETLIKKVQSGYDADIFGFGEKLWEDNPDVFKKTGNNWDTVFRDMKVNVKIRIRIKNSAEIIEPIGEGE